MREWSGSACTKFEEANIHCTTKSVQGGPSGRRPKVEFHHPALDAKLRVRVPEGNTSVYTVHKHSEQTHDDAYATCGPSRRNLPCLRPPTSDRRRPSPVSSGWRSMISPSGTRIWTARMRPCSNVPIVMGECTMKKGLGDDLSNRVLVVVQRESRYAFEFGARICCSVALEVSCPGCSRHVH